MSDVLEPTPNLHAEAPAAAFRTGVEDRSELAAIAVERGADAAGRGALADPQGGLDIRWRTTGDNAARLEVLWDENGAPTAAERETGLCATIVAGLVERQLRGEVRREQRGDRLSVILSVPDALAASGS